MLVQFNIFDVQKPSGIGGNVFINPQDVSAVVEQERIVNVHDINGHRGVVRIAMVYLKNGHTVEVVDEDREAANEIKEGMSRVY